MDRSQKNGLFLKVGLPSIVVVFLCFLFTLMWSHAFIDAEHIGIKVVDGEIQDEILESGHHWQVPFYSYIVLIDDGSKELTRTGLSAATKDNYELGDAEVRATIEFDRETAVTMYRQYGQEWQKRLNSALEDAFNVAAGDVNLFDVAEDRDLLGRNIIKELQSVLDDELSSAPEVTHAHLSYYKWGKQGKAHLRSMQKAKEQKRIAEAEREAQKVRNKKKLEKAKANSKAEEVRQERKAEAKRTQAQAEADSIRKRAKAEKEKLQGLAEVLEDNPALLKRLAIEAWEKGADVPVVVSGDQGVQLDIGKNLLASGVNDTNSTNTQ